MKILLIGDPHFKTSNRLETDQLFDETKRYLDENEIDLIVVLGDVLDTHEKIHVQPLCRSILFIKMLAFYQKTFVLIGNHDRINNNVYMTDEHPFTSLKNYNENLVIVDKTVVWNDFYFVPYVPNGRFKEALGENFENSSAIFAHQEFLGCKMGGIISENGDKWEEDLPPVFSGHIHDYQEVQKNIIYTGTPFQHCFSDGEERGLFVLDIKDKDWNLERIELNIIKKKLISMNISEFEDYKIPRNCVLKIHFYGDPILIKKILEKKNIREKINLHKIRYKIVTKNIKKIEKGSSNFVENLNNRIKKSDSYLNFLYNEIFFN